MSRVCSSLYCLGRGASAAAVQPMGLLWLLMLVLWCCATPALSAQAALAEPGEAPAVHTVWQAEWAEGAIDPSTIGQARWTPVALDHSWRRGGACDDRIRTYRIPLVLTADALADHGLWIHRAGNRLRVWINEHVVAEWGRLDDPRADYSGKPLYARLPHAALGVGENLILIQVAGDCRRYAGLSHLTLGLHQGLWAQWEAASQRQVWTSALILSVCGVLACVGLLFGAWARQPRALLLGLASAAWAARVWLWSMTDLPMPYALWFLSIDVCFGVWLALICWLSLLLQGNAPRRLVQAQALGLMAFVVTSVAVVLGAAPLWKALGILLVVVAGMAALVYIAWQAVRRPRMESVALTLAGVPMWVLGMVDHWNVWLSTAADAYQRFYFTPLIVVFFIAAVGMVMLQQFERAMRTDRQYRESLEREVAAQRQWLEQHFQQQSRLDQQQAVAQERQRIVQDMHDGLGAQLVGMLSAVQNAPAPLPELESDLRQALDQLRVTMDSLSPSGDDLGTVLAQFRFSHQQRLARAGLQLRWQVSPLPQADWSPRALIHAESLLREAFANVLKHARARTVTVRAGCAQGLCFIEVEDDGCGMDSAHRPKGRGMAHLQVRTEALGICLHIHSQPGQGTLLRWEWPPQHRPAV